MADIVLRNRDGKEINYPGVNYIKVNKADGETQGYAAYDPETLVPENLVSGVKVGDVEGALEVPQAVETTIDPDFSAGDMEVVPEDGQVFSKVGVLKPANLTPENIAKDVNIGGVLGTLESGGGSFAPAIMVAKGMYAKKGYVSTSGTLSHTVSVKLLPGAVIHGAKIYYQATYTNASGTDSELANTFSSYTFNPAVTVYNNYQEVSVKRSPTVNKYYIVVTLLEVLFSVPGLYMKTNSNGTFEMYADETCADISYSSNELCPTLQISRADLSNGSFTELPGNMFAFVNCECEVLLPATIQTIGYNALAGAGITRVDFSKCTSVPTIYTGYIKSGAEILVPSALYDEWIAAPYWSMYADYIVAV